MRRLAVAAGLAVVCLAGGACSSGAGSDAPPAFDKPDFDTPKPLALRADALTADRSVSNPATVEDGQVTLPTGGANDAFLAKVQIGTVIAGDRDTATPDLTKSKNPYGFLRRVIGIDRSADHVVLHTQQAYLNELFKEGDLVWDPQHPRASIFDGASGVVTTNSLRPQDNGPQSSGGSGAVDANTELDDEEHNSNIQFRPVISLSNSRVGVDTTFTGELQIREFMGLPYGVSRASARLDLDPVVSTDITYGVKVQTAQNAFGGALYKQWESPSIPIPIGGPIPLTVRLFARVVCSVQVSGAIELTSRVWLRGHTAAGFVYNGGFDIQPTSDAPTLTAGHDFLGVTGKASLVGQCALQGVIGVMAFDALGLQGAFGPYASVEADVCASDGSAGVNGGFALWEQHGLEVDVGGRLQVPGLGEPSVEKDIFGFKPVKSAPNYFVGSKATCLPKAPDSCADKPNGLYCSTLAPYGAYQCNAGVVAGGQQCSSGQKCVGPNGGGSTIQCQ